MPSMYGKSFSEKSRIWEGEKAKRDLVKANQRIAELEAKLTHNEQTCVPCEVCQRGFHPQFMYNDGGVIRCAHCVIKHERETRVPDELLEWLLSKAHYSAAWGDNYDEAEAILAKRKEAHND